MEQPLIQLDGPEEQVLDSNKQFEQSEHSGRQLWTLKSDADSLDWLADFSTPVNSLQPLDLPASAEAPEIFGDACEEDQFISMTTVDSSEESRSWLSSLENNSELDHQMAEASMTASMTSFELTATEQAEQAVRFLANRVPIFFCPVIITNVGRHYVVVVVVLFLEWEGVFDTNWIQYNLYKKQLAQELLK